MKESESLIQQRIVVFFRNNYQRKGIDKGVVFSVPNERNGYAQMQVLLKTGLMSGVSDLIIVQPNKILFVEVKTSTGVQSVVQKDFQTKIETLGFEYHLVRSLDEFKKII